MLPKFAQFVGVNTWWKIDGLDYPTSNLGNTTMFKDLAGLEQRQSMFGIF